MTPPPLPSVVHTLLTLCDDAFFATAATAKLDQETLRALAKRRSGVITAAAKGARPDDMGQGDPWIVRLAAAMAPIAPPRWMPMADVIEEGLSLELGARGVRSLFTSKPSEKDVARVRSLGSFAVRVLGAVLTVGANPRPDAQLAKQCLVASLGLPDDEQRALLEEPPAAAESLEIPQNLSPKLARAILRGAFTAAMLEGEGAREEQAVLLIGHKTGLPGEEITAAHGEARRAVEAGKTFGEAGVDALRFVLHDDPDERSTLAGTFARITLPIQARRDATEALNQAGPMKKHALDRRTREAVLGVVWAGVLRSNPSFARRAELVARHSAAAAELGGDESALEARKAIEAFLEPELCAATLLAPSAPR
ncbi:MAG: hypothetical protein HUU21_29090 [Polyangiaceae bacterium]|nr:hypothetical protein [Polyangiaceae bacterium]